MDIPQILVNIFGEYPSLTRHSKKDLKNINFEEHITELDLWLDDKLSNNNYVEDQKQAGRIGPLKTVLDVSGTGAPLVHISKDKLTVQSQSAFSTIKANVAVYKGKWMYEVQLRSKGVMQIGFCSAKCKFTQDTGVGDTKFSYGLDGSKQRVWHVYTQKYGPYWRSGDIFGVCLDMDDGTIEYFRNGVGLGEAFNNIERGPGLALFPAVSLAFNDSLTANFGGSPFRHPVPGYKPLQIYPEGLLNKADCLLQYLANLARIISRKSDLKHKIIADQSQPSLDTVYVVISALLVDKIASLLHNSYVIEEKVFSFIRSMCVIRSEADKDTVIHPGSEDSTLGEFLTLLWTYMETEEMKIFLKKFINYLSSIYKETPTDLEYERQRRVIVVLTCICNHSMTRKHLLEFKFFMKNCLPLFLYIKPPDESVLEQLLPDEHIWTDGIGGPRDKYFKACDKLKSCTLVLYNLQKNLMNTLLNNSDGNENVASSRKIFLCKFRKYVMENSLEHRALFLMQGNYTTPTQPAVGLSFLCILLDITKTLWNESNKNGESMFVDTTNFYDGTLMYSNIDRLGGILSHLKKVNRPEMIALLGENHIALSSQATVDIQNLGDIYSAMFLISGNSSTAYSMLDRNSTIRTDEKFTKIPGGCVDEQKSLCQLLDCSVLYYYAVAHKYVVMIADLRDNIALLSDILHETRNSCDDVIKNLEELKSVADNGIISVHDEILKEMNQRFSQRKGIFEKRSMELARKQAWYRSVALGDQRRNLLCWLLQSIFKSLQVASTQKQMFSFVPEVYVNVLPILLDTVLDFSFHDMSSQYDLSESKDLVVAGAEFLGEHSADSRVVLASCKDALLQALGTLICHEEGIRALELCTESSQLCMVRSLLRPYENRAWGQSNWLLLRFWLGQGYAFREARPPSIWQGGNKPISLGLHRSRGKHGSHTGLLHHIAPACPSQHFQNLISNLLINDEPYSTVFVNSVLSQLNWAFSEFILLLQEIQNVSHRQEQNIVVESRQLKICAMCFELTVSLMRALEMIITIAPEIFQDTSRSNSDLLLGRICQLVSQVLSRVSIPPGCFQHVLDLCLPDLSCVNHFSIISAAIGILLALMQNEMIHEDRITKVPRVSRFLLTDPSFHIASLEFALGDVQTPLLVPNDVPRGNFDPKMRTQIDGPNKNDGREIIPDPPVIQFSLRDYSTHVTLEELNSVRQMIDVLLLRQTLLSDVVLPSEDSLCSICYAKPIGAVFSPCGHQSCGTCIIQHLMSSKVCFYCKTFITAVVNSEGTVLYENQIFSNEPSPTRSED